MTDLCDKHWGNDRDEFDSQRLVCPDCEYERWVKLVEENRLDSWDKINKKSHKVTQLQEKLEAVSELAQSWICTAQKPTVGEEMMDKCGMELLELLGEEPVLEKPQPKCHIPNSWGRYKLANEAHACEYGPDGNCIHCGYGVPF